MGRYAELTFVTEAEVPESPGDFVAREAWAGRLFAAAILLALGCGASYALYQLTLGGGIAPWLPELAFESLLGAAMNVVMALIAVATGLIGLLGGFAFLTEVAAARRPGNWVLRARPEGLYVKLRRFTDYRLSVDDPIVAVIPRRELRWLRGHGQLARRVGRSGEHASREDDALGRQSYLEIALYGQEAAQEIEARLKRERTLWRPTFIKGVRTGVKGTAVSVRPGGVIRIDWSTKGTRLRPKLAAALERLARDYPLAPELETEQAQAKRLDREAQETRLLDMVRQGNIIDAAIVAKNLYGFTTTEAKRFLEELRGR